MPVVTVAMHEGRTIDQKRALVKEITEVVARTIGVDPTGVQVIIDEIKLENWSAGGQLSADRKR